MFFVNFPINFIQKEEEKCVVDFLNTNQYIPVGSRNFAILNLF